MSFLKMIFRLLRVTFISGPWMLLTSRLSVKSASMMIMLSVPALLFFTLMTLPSFLFADPEQHAYFYFAAGLTHDPIRWVGLALATACSLFALSLPATAQQPLAGARF